MESNMLSNSDDALGNAVFCVLISGEVGFLSHASALLASGVQSSDCIYTAVSADRLQQQIRQIR